MKIQVTKSHNIIYKRQKNGNLSDKSSQHSVKRHKNVNLGDKKSQHSAKKTEKWKFM